MSLFSSTAFITAFLFAFVGGFGLIFSLIVASNEATVRAHAALRTEGVAATAVIKGYRRISMTQHRVLCEVRLPGGAVGREYVLVGLRDDWLAHHAGLGQPVAVFVRPDAATILLADYPSGPVRSRAQSVRRFAATMLGLFALCLVMGFGMAFVMRHYRQAEQERLVDPRVLRLRDALVAAGLEVDDVQHLRSTESRRRRASISLEDDRCLVDLHQTPVSPPAAREETLAGGDFVLRSGPLVLQCPASLAALTPRLRSVVASFRP